MYFDPIKVHRRVTYIRSEDVNSNKSLKAADGLSTVCSVINKAKEIL